MISFAFIIASIQPSIVNDDYLDRIAIIESNYNHLAVGDNYKARGAYQLHEDAWDDGIRSIQDIDCSNWSYRQDAFHAERSREVCRAFLKMMEQRLIKDGYRPTKERLYMCYNMGYNGAHRYQFNPENSRIPYIRRAVLRRAFFYLRK